MADIASNIKHVTVGRRVSYNTYTGVVRYIGPLPGTIPIWVGIEWDDPFRGKHNGIHDGIRYFKTL